MNNKTIIKVAIAAFVLSSPSAFAQVVGHWAQPSSVPTTATANGDSTGIISSEYINDGNQPYETDPNGSQGNPPPVVPSPTPMPVPAPVPTPALEAHCPAKKFLPIQGMLGGGACRPPQSYGFTTPEMSDKQIFNGTGSYSGSIFQCNNGTTSYIAGNSICQPR